MIIKLKGADFSANNINSLLNSWPITFYKRTLVTGTFVSSVSKGSTYTATFSVAENCTVDSVSITRGGTTISGATISGSTISISVPTTAESGPISITFNGSREDGGDVVDPDTPVVPDEPEAGVVSVAWEMGAITSNQSGLNAEGMDHNRIRTTNFLQVNGSITISCSGNAEFCPIYFNANKEWVASPNKYQTESCVVNSSEYPIVRIMARDKTNTSACDISLAQNITITGSVTEIPYSESEPEPETPTRNIPPLADTATWYVGALNSSNGEIVAMGTRLYSNRFALTSSSMTIEVSGNAEICPVWYKADGSFNSSPAAYQTTPITTTSADGDSVSFMIRDKTNINATLTTNFGANVTISN